MSEGGSHDETRETRMLQEVGGTLVDKPRQAAEEGPSKDTGPVMRAGIKLVETAFRGSRRERDPDADVFDPSNFRQVKNSWWLDRLLPGRVSRYFIAGFVTCTVVWLIGLTLRLSVLGFENIGHEIWQFIKDRQWQLQPLLLLVHFVCLRLFKGIYSRNFDRAFVHLDVRQSELDEYKRWFLGNRVNFMAFGLALPFIAWEIIHFATSVDFYQTMFGATSAYVQKIDTTGRNAEAWFLLMLWIFEWLMYGYYCYLMISGALVVRSIMKRHDFKDSVDLVLTERQYRPLFNVTAQAGSLVFFFGLIHAAYMFYTKSTWTDGAGLILLVLLLSSAFGMTWSAVRGELRGQVFGAIEELEASYRQSREKLGTMKDVPGIEDDIQRIQVQLKMQLALQQLDYLQTKYESLGRKEFLGLVFKMLAPVGSVLARVIRWGSLLAAIGLGGAAAITGSADRQQQPPTVKEAPAQPGSNAP
ncbi:MAG: hypothetical protein H6841_06590 [Planctomycetes bacterium]|nr:hypothetical protein [Planctomycetota bacterium]MCB9936214.1 hypothetical protein [Planctomycetota bacterium]